MSNPLYDALPLSENPLNPDAEITRPAALAGLLHVFNAGWELGTTGALAGAITDVSKMLYPKNEAYKEWLTAGFVYGVEDFGREEAVKDFLNYKEGKKSKMKDIYDER